MYSISASATRRCAWLAPCGTTWTPHIVSLSPRALHLSLRLWPLGSPYRPSLRVRHSLRCSSQFAASTGYSRTSDPQFRPSLATNHASPLNCTGPVSCPREVVIISAHTHVVCASSCTPANTFYCLAYVLGRSHT